MQIADIFRIKGIDGPVATMTLDMTPVGDLRKQNVFALAKLVRSDGTAWPIRGVEANAKLGPPVAGDSVGILLPEGADAKIGDEVRIEQGTP